MNDLVRTLAEFSLFAGLDDRALQEIARHVRERAFEPDQVLALVNEPCQDVYLIVRGIVRARRLSLEGREYVIEYVRAGELFSLVPALDGGSNLATGEALTPTTAYLISCDRLRQIVHDHKSVAAAALGHLAARVRYLSDTVEDLALHTVRARLARFLLSRKDNGARPSQHWTQEEIAAHIGTVRDVVGRTLRTFAQKGLVRRERGRLVVTNRAGLEREAMYA